MALSSDVKRALPLSGTAGAYDLLTNEAPTPQESAVLLDSSLGVRTRLFRKIYPFATLCGRRFDITDRISSPVTVANVRCRPRRPKL